MKKLFQTRDGLDVYNVSKAEMLRVSSLEKMAGNGYAYPKMSKKRIYAVGGKKRWIVHELVEARLMQKGWSYQTAHLAANIEETLYKVGLVSFDAFC